MQLYVNNTERCVRVAYGAQKHSGRHGNAILHVCMNYLQFRARMISHQCKLHTVSSLLFKVPTWPEPTGIEH